MSVVAPQLDSQLWASRPFRLKVRGPEGERCIRFDKPYALIGSHPRADVVLAQGDLPACGIYLHATEDGIYCLGLEAAPGTRSAPRGWLGEKLGVQFGRYRIKAEFDDDGPPPSDSLPDPWLELPAQSASPQLRLICPEQLEFAGNLQIIRQFTLVGRRPTSGLQIKHASLSGIHCLLYWDGACLWIVDLLSESGVQLEGRIVAAARILPNQLVKLGDVGLMQQSAGDASPDAWAADSDAVCHRSAERGATAMSAPLAGGTPSERLADALARQTERVRLLEQQLASLTGETDFFQMRLLGAAPGPGEERVAVEHAIAARLTAGYGARGAVLEQFLARLEALERGRERLVADLQRQAETTAALRIAIEMELAAHRRAPSSATTQNAAREPAFDQPTPASAAIRAPVPWPVGSGQAATSFRGAGLGTTSTERTNRELAGRDIAPAFPGEAPPWGEAAPTDPLLGQLYQFQTRESSFDRRRRLLWASLATTAAAAAAAGMIALIVWSDSLYDRFAGQMRSDRASAPLANPQGFAEARVSADELALEGVEPTAAELLRELELKSSKLSANNEKALAPTESNSRD